MITRLIVLTCTSLIGLSSGAAEEPISLERGRYLVRITGCNDCHTPMYGPKNGVVPEKEWLSGVPVGWKGPWGTTYASNLRQSIGQKTEDQWVSYAKSLKARPPMPFFALNEMKEADLRSIFKYVRSLGTHEQIIPEALPPGMEPKTPYINFDVIMPSAPKAKKKS